MGGLSLRTELPLSNNPPQYRQKSSLSGQCQPKRGATKHPYIESWNVIARLSLFPLTHFHFLISYSETGSLNIMTGSLLDTTWIWHPEWQDSASDSAGAFVHFRKPFAVPEALPTTPVVLQVTADTKYRMHINGHLAHVGPVKGDAHMWFYDEVDIAPFLQPGVNNIGIHVLRLYHGTAYGTSFPRMAIPGLFVRMPDITARETFQLQSDDSWLTALDLSRKLPTHQKEDDFLHIYEDVISSSTADLQWVPAKCLKLPKSHGLGPPWRLVPRMIPEATLARTTFKTVHNVRSTNSKQSWEALLTTSLDNRSGDHEKKGIRLPAGTSHHIELEAPHHLAAFLSFRFLRPHKGGSSLTIRYSECYEDEPTFVPYIRCKGDRCDTSKKLLGPEDRYVLSGAQGAKAAEVLQYARDASLEETYTPFHFRTFRFLTLIIQVAEDEDLVFAGINVDETHYPLDVTATACTTHELYDDLWNVSIRTLTNCMHDCYEDCPFYEQLQYAMDTRSSCLFTYAVSGDDRLARQALLQLHGTYRAELGLIASRGPAAQVQIIPHFSLFWILTVVDHFEHFGDASFTRQFLSAADGIFESFERRLNADLGLVAADTSSFWEFVDWTPEWQPRGVPPAAERTGYLTLTSLLYAHTLKRLSTILSDVGRPGLKGEFEGRSVSLIEAVRKHCRVGEVFTDGLASTADRSQDFSQQTQIWAVLSGAVSGDAARGLLKTCLPVLNPFLGTNDPGPDRETSFTAPSLAMTFYVFRALSTAGGTLYDDAFHEMWSPWRLQLAQNLTTWCEDHVTHRSDCHAWGCSPLHELTVEVAGVRPAEPGWGSVDFRPRTALFPRFDGKVPLGARGVAHVKWKQDDGHGVGTIVSIAMEGPRVEAGGIPVYVTFPDGREERHIGRSLTFKF